MADTPHDPGATRFEDLARVQLPLDDGLRAEIHHRFGVELDADAVQVDGGDECAIWRVGDVVVRIGPVWRTDEELRWTHDLVRHVARIVPEAIAPIAAADGSTSLRYAGHPVSLFPFIAGDVPDRTSSAAHAAGALLARVHGAIARRVSPEPSPATAGRHVREPLPRELVDADLDRWHASLSANGSPRAAIHGDVYRRNILVRDGRIVALLDWDEAHDDFVAQEIAWTMWEFAKVDGMRLDERLASAFLDGYVSAGQPLPAGFRTDAIGFIRWRLREELQYQLTARTHGEPFDEDYYEDELTAFALLRGTELFPGRFGPSETTAGRGWMSRVPALVSSCCERWGVEITQEPAWTGWHAVVTPVRRGTDACVLKLTMDAEAADAEARALAAWDGRGAVRLLASDPASGALLLEQVGPRTLRDLDLVQAAEMAGAILRRLAIAAPDGFTLQSDLATSITTSLPERDRRLGDPVDARRLDQAVRLAAELAQADAGCLVHSDLHYGNVLAGEREPWLVIDPRPVSGDPELAVPELLWSRHGELDGPTALEQLLDVVVRTGDLDAERARSWVVVRCVDYWIWGLEHGLTEDPIRCRRILEALA